MQTEDEVRRLTMDEIALLREVFRWARNRNIQRNTWTGGVWREHVHGKRVAIDDGLIGWAPDRWTDYHWLAVNSVKQAVDVLVSMGYLPQRFSSAYGRGWHAAQVWESPALDADDPDEFARLFHDPENISFPVGECR